MKTINIISFMVILMIAVQSCCQKQGCIGLEDVREVEIYNFTAEELDSIIIYSFEKNTNFTTLIDTIFTKGYPIGDSFFSARIGQININQDYRINIINANQTFSLTGLETERSGCNKCFPYRPKSDYYTRIKSYQVNGQTKQGNIIQINN